MALRQHRLGPDPRTLNDIHENDDIFIKIEIGNGQIGGSSINHGEKMVAKGDLTKPVFVGKARDLKQKEIDVETNILDVNPVTNMCVLTTTFYNQKNRVLFSTIDKGEAPLNGVASFKAKYLVTILSIAFLIFACTNFVHSQTENNSNSITLDDLQTPTSPGFTLLENAPSSIDRPTNPQGFGLSLLGFFQGTGGAMEFTPFWLFDHPKLSAEKMYKDKFPIFRNLSVSAATIKNDTSNYLAGGIRTRIIEVNSKNKINKLDSLRLEIQKLLSSDIANNLQEIEELRQEYVDLLDANIEKPVFTIDFAAAIGANSPLNSFENLEVNRWAAWLTLNYRPGGDNFCITALTRYLNNKKFSDYSTQSDLIEIGTRLNYDISTNMCLSFEYTQRLNLTQNLYNDLRIAVIGSYKLSDNIYITSTFGRNFSDTNKIIALAGINFGFSNNKLNASPTD
jgi:hypothetical protein